MIKSATNFKVFLFMFIVKSQLKEILELWSSFKILCEDQVKLVFLFLLFVSGWFVRVLISGY